MQKGNASTFDSPQVRFLLRMPLPRGLSPITSGAKLFRFLLTIQGLGAFALITLGVLLTKFRTARHVIWPLILHETSRAGLRLLPMFLFIALALGLCGDRPECVVADAGRSHQLPRHDHGDGGRSGIGAAAGGAAGAGAHWHSECRRTGHGSSHRRSRGARSARHRSGALSGGAAGRRAGLGRLFAHGLSDSGRVAQRLFVGVSAGCAACGRAIISDSYRGSSGLDFALLALKTLAFGFIISIVTCYHGLAQPLRLEEVSYATVRAVAQSIIACVLIDALFIVIYLAS